MRSDISKPPNPIFCNSRTTCMLRHEFVATDSTFSRTTVLAHRAFPPPTECLMKCILTLLLICMLAGTTTSVSRAQSPAPIIVDHTSVSLFDRIPPQWYDAARHLRMLFMDRSVGGNISDALDCLAAPVASAPSRCKRWEHTGTPPFSSDPSEVSWPGVWSRANWRYEYWPANCNPWYGSVDCFAQFIEPRIDSFDVVSFQFSYLEVAQGSNIAHPVDGFFGTRTDRGTATAYAALAARHPDTRLIWWTTSLARGIGSAEARDFNDAMRAHARSNNLILFDVADILSHAPDGAPCYDNRDGRPYTFGSNTENHPDDGLDLPAICPHYTTETEGGHLGSVSAGGIRVAKAFWVLMARIAGWQPEGDTLFAATPLTDMGSSMYKSFDGGLYGSGSNTLPAAHALAGRRLAEAIEPLDTLGRPDPQGAIVLLSIGMSNATQEFSAFQAMADTFALRNPRVVVVDGAQGGQTASIISNPDAAFWTNIERQRLPARGVRAAQVQSVWLKEANAGPTQAFPTHAYQLRDDLASIVRVLRIKYPNLMQVFLSSRTYGGYATTTLNPEPYAYESGFAVQWLVRAQIDGEPSLNFDDTDPRAPWLAWGPYLWTSGATPRAADGLVWLPTDVAADGTHPSPNGRLKVGRLLLDFFASDSLTALWFLKQTPTAVEALRTPPSLHLSVAPHPVRGGTLLTFTLGEPAFVRMELFDMLGARVAVLDVGARGAGAHTVALDASRVLRSPGVYLARVTAAGTASPDVRVATTLLSVLL